MSRQDANAAFALTSFLYGSNAAYIEDLYARFEADPASVDAEWQAFFSSLKDSATDVARSARGASWKRRNWPRPERSELVSALDGDWREVEKTVGDKLMAKAQVSGGDERLRRRDRGAGRPARAERLHADDGLAERHPGLVRRVSVR